MRRHGLEEGEGGVVLAIVILRLDADRELERAAMFRRLRRSTARRGEGERGKDAKKGLRHVRAQRDVLPAWVCQCSN